MSKKICDFLENLFHPAQPANDEILNIILFFKFLGKAKLIIFIIRLRPLFPGHVI